jgi:flagellar hook-associated protein 3 FlgL
MRISTNTMYELGVGRISDLQAGMVRTQQQIATNRRILTPADDPIASARALELSQGKSINEQFAVNRQNASNTLIQDVQTLTVSAGNGALDDQQRRHIATELQSRFDEMLGLANTRDGTGNYMFAGFRVTTQPFSVAAGGAAYHGDQGQRMLQIGTGRQIPLNDSGSEVFEGARTGNGTFVATAASGNTGGGVAGIGSVTDATQLTHHDYRIDFHVVEGVTTYDVIDTTAGLPAVSSGNAFKPGDSIGFHGMQFEVKGAPADNDSMNVEPSRNESIFTTLRDLIDVLNQSSRGTAAQARLSGGLIQAGAGLDSMLDNVLSVRATLGARLKEIDTLDSAGSDRDLNYAKELSELQDIDYAKALSELSQQKTMLEAAQKSFVTVSGLSLFKLL